MSKKNIKQKSRKKEVCDGIFGLFNCRLCGSANIRVMFKPEFEYTYVEEDESINISRIGENIEFRCADCCSWYGTVDPTVPYLNLIKNSVCLENEVNIKRINDVKFKIARLINTYYRMD
jgi:hypothetical protein